MRKTIKIKIQRQPKEFEQFLKEVRKVKKVQFIGPLIGYQSDIDTSLPTIFIDGGTKVLKKRDFKIFISLGDGDSSKTPLGIKLPTRKNCSDLKFGLDLMKDTATSIQLLGFSSKKQEKRLDHLLANIGESYFHCKKYSKIISIDQKLIILPKGVHQLNFTGHFGLLTLEKSRLKMHGNIDYQIIESSILSPLSSLGISNYSYGKFKIENNRPVIIVLTEE